MYSLELLMMDGKTVQKMWRVVQKKYKFKKVVHLVGITIEIYRVIQNDCRGFNNLSHTIHLR